VNELYEYQNVRCNDKKNYLYFFKRVFWITHLKLIILNFYIGFDIFIKYPSSKRLPEDGLQQVTETWSLQRLM